MHCKKKSNVELKNVVVRLRDGNTICNSKECGGRCRKDRNAHQTRRETERRQRLKKMYSVEELHNPSGGHLGKKKENDEFETWLFDVAILHHGRGRCRKLDLAVANIIG